MRIVVELDELKMVGFAVRENRDAFETVYNLIASAPSLADVIGANAAEPYAEVPPRERIIELLRESDQWLSTAQVGELVGVNRTTAADHLKKLHAAGEVERREAGSRRQAEWRLT